MKIFLARKEVIQMDCVDYGNCSTRNLFRDLNVNATNFVIHL